MDLSKLTDEQLDLADKIAKRAKAKGLNPDFVLPLVMAESGFNPKAVSKKGAIGVMQLMPETATGLRVDPHNIDENIEGGLNLLKELIANKKIGNDPYKVLAGYNTSTATRNKFLESGDLSVLPDETINYMDKVSTYFGGNLPTVTGEVVAEAAKPEPEAEPGEGDVVDDTIKPAPKGLPNETDPYAVAGGITGASIASSVETGKRALPLIQGLYDKATGSTDQMYRPQSRASLQRYLNSQIANDLRIPLKDLEKVSGGKPVRTMSEVQDALAYLKEVPEQKITKPVYKPQSYGSKTLVDTGKVTPTTIPGKPAVDLSAYKHTPTLATRAADQASKGTDLVKGALPSVGRIGLGAFGGAMAGVQGYDAYELAKKIERDKAEGRTQQTVMGLTPDQWRLASKTAATAGGVASMFPLGITQVLGGIAQAPELALSVYDYMNRPKEAQTNKGGLSGP
jgi:hypothetical protein